MLAEIFSFLYQFADVFAFLILASAGLAIVFGMMGVINMAHGEFIMCGAYVTVGLVNAGFPLILAQACATLAAALIGVLVEVAIVRKLYKRPLDSLLATWGLSLIVTQGMLLIFGGSMSGPGTPPGSFTVGDYTFSIYRLVLFAAAIGVYRVHLHRVHAHEVRRLCPGDDAERVDRAGARRQGRENLRAELRHRRRSGRAYAARSTHRP